MDIRIYVANLGAYNRGELSGEWINLPMDKDELREAIKKALNSSETATEDDYDEECAIHDYEAPFHINEYDDIYELNEVAQRIEDADIEEDVFNAIFEDCGNDLESAVSIAENNDYSLLCDVSTIEDLGQYAVDEGLFGVEIPDNLYNYIDFQAIGRDMQIEGWTIVDNSFAICIY